MAQEAGKLLITCSCGQKMKVPASAIGKSVKCVQCGDKVTITDEPTTVADPIPENFERGDNPDPHKPIMPSADDSSDLLINGGFVDQSQLDEAMIVQSDLPGTTWSTLIDMGYLTSDQFHGIMSKAENVASIELENYNVPDDVISLLPENIIRQNLVVPVDKLGKLLTLAMVCPLSRSVIKEVENITGLRVKTMLCTYDAMRDTIKAKLPFSSTDGDDIISMSLSQQFSKALSEKIIARRVFRQTSLAPSNAESNQLNDCPKDDLVALTKISSNNPVLLSKVLQLANSAAYGFPGKVTSPGQAAALLGPEALLKAMNGVESIDYKKKHKTFDFGAHLKRSRFCAVAARTLAKEIECEEPEAAYSAGLLFEIGRLVLLEALPNGYATTTRDEIGRDLYDIENQMYQFPHTEAGYYILSRCNIPSIILEPVRFHTNPKDSGQHSQLTNILFLAVVMTKAYVNNRPLHVRTDEEDAMHSLGTNPEKLEAVFQAATAEFEQTLVAN